MKKKTELEYFNSKEFKEQFRKTVESQTWEKDLPMIYLNKNKQIVKHWKDGRIEIIEQL